MNRADSVSDNEQEPDYSIAFRRTTPRADQRLRPPDHARRQRPAGYNGIHRRHNKRWTW